MSKTLEYIKRFNNHVTNEQTESIRTSLSREGVKEPEATHFWNLCPTSVEEACTLIPKLKAYPEDAIMRLIKEVNN